MNEESFTPEEQRVIAAARDLAALDKAEDILRVLPGPSDSELATMDGLVKKAERILYQTVAALLASERRAP